MGPTGINEGQPGYLNKGAEGGAFIKTAYLEREVKAYAVFETEVEALSSFNAQTTVYFSVASSLLAFAIGIWTTALFTDKLSPEASVACRIVGPLLIVLSLIGFWLAISSSKKRQSTIATIKAQSVSKTKDGPAQ
jgi:hypothetical protein